MVNVAVCEGGRGGSASRTNVPVPACWCFTPASAHCYADGSFKEGPATCTNMMNEQPHAPLSHSITAFTAMYPAGGASSTYKRKDCQSGHWKQWKLSTHVHTPECCRQVPGKSRTVRTTAAGCGLTLSQLCPHQPQLLPHTIQCDLKGVRLRALHGCNRDTWSRVTTPCTSTRIAQFGAVGKRCAGWNFAML